MQADSYFFIGKTHTVCEDYATHNNNAAIVCDGCSSSVNTDFGSRILARLFINNSLDIYDNNYLTNYINEAGLIADKLGLNNTCLDSTVLYLKDNREYIDVLMIGDGTLAIIRDDGTINITDISFKSAAPRYLNYFNDPEREEKYTAQFGNERTIQYFDLPCVDFRCERNNDWFYKRSIKKTGNKAVLVMSDGIQSFSRQIVTDTGKMQEPVSYVEVMKELLDFKGFGGRFIERRVSWFQNKNMCKNNWVNNDDFSIAGIYFKE